MPVITEHMKWRRPRNKFRHPISETDPSSQISSIIQSTHCKSTISSLLSTFSNNTSNETTHASVQNSIKKEKKKNNNITNSNFSAATLRGLGCTAGASEQVSVPAVIRSSADWEGKKNRKKKHRRNSNSNKTCHGVVDDVPFHGSSSATCVDFQDVWCGPGIGFSADAAASVDCVVARKNVSSRGKLDGERITHRERSSYFGRRTINTESLSFLDDDDDSDVFNARPGGLECFGNARFYRHAPHPSPDGLSEAASYLTPIPFQLSCSSSWDMFFCSINLLIIILLGTNLIYPRLILNRGCGRDAVLNIAENRDQMWFRCRDIKNFDVANQIAIMIIQGRLMGGRFNSRDQFRDWRLDVDHMSYEQLLELGERIGYVNTGLKEDEMGHNIRKIKLLISNDTSKHQIDRECSICQEEYELDDELGRLNCEHSYHFQCIKQWLVLKNFCPVCKQEVVARHS